jgi:L-asparaginase/Glu-tRNA(Gln) amidotransferase subunit D
MTPAAATRPRLYQCMVLFASAASLVGGGTPAARAQPHTGASRVHLLATGGTISGGDKPLDAAGLAALIPDLTQIA